MYEASLFCWSRKNTKMSNCAMNPVILMAVRAIDSTLLMYANLLEKLSWQLVCDGLVGVA